MDLSLSRLRIGRTAIIGGASSTLNDGIVSFWTLNEESGTRADSVGSNDLTDNNTVGFDTGKVGNAASFVQANSEYLSVTDDSLNTGDEDFTLALWIKPTSTGVGTGFLSIVGVEGECVIWYRGSFSDLRVRVWRSVSGTLDLAGGGSLATDAFTSLVLWYDQSAQTLYMSKNNAAAISTSLGEAKAAATSNPFTVGSENTVGSYFDGLIDAVGFWGRVLTDDERTELSNSGDGAEYPF